MTLFYFNILLMTLLYLLVFKIILFLVYHSYILGLVRLDLYTCLGSYSIYPLDPWVNDRYCVGVVLIPYLSAIVRNMLDRGVVRDSDSFIDSYIVPLSCIGLAECGGINPYTLTARLGPGGLAHYETNSKA